MARQQTKTLFRKTTHWEFSEDWVSWRAWVVAVFVTVIGTLVFAGTLALGLWVASISCRQFGDQLTLETESRIPSGCYVSIDGEWIPGDAYRATEGVNR